MLQQTVRTLTTQVGAAVDRALLAAIQRQLRTRPRDAAPLSHADRLRGLDAIRERYATEAFVSDHERFFPVRDDAPPVRERPAGLFEDGAPIVDLSWVCEAPAIDAAVGTRIDSDTHNQAARVRWIGHGQSGRPALILIHGYLGGDPHWEQRFFPVRELRAWGLDVAIVSLPFHGPRKDPSRKGAPKFPSVDPAFNIEVWRRAVIELRELVRIARARGASSVGVLGMSLGGCTTALLGCAEPTLSVCVPMIPLSSLADFSLHHRQLPGTGSQQRELHAALERAMAAVSPVHRRAVIASERITVLAARGDQITPPAQAERIAAAHDAKLLWFDGGHMLQLGRSKALQGVRQQMVDLGVLDAR